MRLLASLVGSEVSAKLDSEKSTVRLPELTQLAVDGRNVLIGYAYAMPDSLVSSFVVAPHRPPLFEPLMREELTKSLEEWARVHERLTMEKLRDKLESEGQKKQISLQDSLTEMVCGVSHEINTTLGVIRTASAVISGFGQRSRRRKRRH